VSVQLVLDVVTLDVISSCARVVDARLSMTLTSVYSSKSWHNPSELLEREICRLDF